MPSPRQPKTRTRLAPEERRVQILECAARLITSEGLDVLSMERVADEAGVSKALVYAYFDSRKGLLAQLLEADLNRIQAEQARAAQGAQTFPDLVKATTHIALSEIEQRGPLLRRLLNEPSLTGAVGLVRMRGHDANARYLARRIQREFDLTHGQALKLTEIGLGLTIAAGELIQRGGALRDEIEETTCAMIIGAVRAGAEKIRARK
jgi:TetR/AcrR family transcriptional regulator, fatty acid biosynthesis regulator